MLPRLLKENRGGIAARIAIEVRGNEPLNHTKQHEEGTPKKSLFSCCFV
jgi:hypothetical protein